MTGVFAFGHRHDRPARELADLLGGKGAGLAEMTSLGLNVPPGFTISLPVSRAYVSGGWPAGLTAEIEKHVAELGRRMGRFLGDVADPLLVAVRSGAPVSMPGMLDTVLNLGLNDVTVRGLAEVSGDAGFAWDSYRRFVVMYATTVLGLDQDVLGADLDADAPQPDAGTLQQRVAALKARIADAVPGGVPDDPFEQLRTAVEAVFKSWDSPRARAYRAHEDIPEDLGTAVNVQAMVFGNRGPDSGTGVVFTRDPATGDPRPYGDYLPCAQGEEVVAGTARTLPISGLAEHFPAACDELTAVLRRLEMHYRDICDVEFTLEEGRLWLLQTRAGKRGPVAAVRIACDLVDDPEIRLTPAEALERAPESVRALARAELLARCADAGPAADLLATGLGASPGRVTGRVALSTDAAIGADDDVILVRRETSPADVPGMAVSVGVLTTKGGLVSHAAVVARGWSIPAVVGAHDLSLVDGALVGVHGQRVGVGELITIDGTTGCVWRGAVETAGSDEAGILAHLPQLARLEKWAAAAEQREIPA